MSTFVDTSAWFAAVNLRDGSHNRVKGVLVSATPLVTTDHVLVESWQLLHHKLGSHIAAKFWEELRNGVAAIEPVGLGDLEAAWEIGQEWDDQDFSIVDLTSFAVMRRLGIDRVASLDEHFAIFRFGPKRRRSFAVVR